MGVDFGDSPPQEPLLVAAQLRYSLLHSPSLSSSKSKDSKDKLNILTQLKNIIIANDFTYFAQVAAETIPEFTLTLSEKEGMVARNEQRFNELQGKLNNAKENEGEVEILDCHKAIAEFMFHTKSKEQALEALNELDTIKGMTTGAKIDNCLKKILLGLIYTDLDLLQRTCEDCEKLLEFGGDWERRNRFTVYRAFYHMLSRDFEKASDPVNGIISVLASFGSTELCSFGDLIFYGIISALVSQKYSRSDLKKKLIDSPDLKAQLQNPLSSLTGKKAGEISVESEIKKVQYLEELLESIYNMDYATYMGCIVKLFERISSDRYLGEHSKWLVRELRLRAYTQFLRSFKTVTIEMMSYEFQMSETLVEKEIARFIISGRIKGKIDKVNGVIEIEVEGGEGSAGNGNILGKDQFQEVIKRGDLLLNKVQTLARLLGV